MGQLHKVVLAAGLGLAVSTVRAQVPFDISPPEIAPTAQTSAPNSSLQPMAASPTVPPGGHPLDSADLEAFFDGILPLQLERCW